LELVSKFFFDILSSKLLQDNTPKCS